MQLTVEQVLEEYGGRKRNAVLLADFMMQRFACPRAMPTTFAKTIIFTSSLWTSPSKFPMHASSICIGIRATSRSDQSKRPYASGNLIEYARLWDYEQVKSIRAARTLAALADA
jgi:hypothetical protein